MDREDAKHLITTCVAESEMDVKATRFPKAEVLGDIFSLAVNTHKTDRGDARASNTITSSIWRRRLRTSSSATPRASAPRTRWTSTICWCSGSSCMQEHAEVREHYQRRFQFILVDEYQDTNKLQSDLIDLLAARHQNVMVVGDDAQSIYAWRGANFQNILKFPERYPAAKVYKIETNYRSTPEILNVANAAIARQRGPVRQRAGARRASRGRSR